MEVVGDRLARFDGVAEALLDESVLPRLTAVAERFSNSLPPYPHSKARCATLEFEATDDFPASARLSVQILLVPGSETVRVVVETHIIPALMPFTKEGAFELGLQNPDPAQLDSFLDDRLCQFLSEYIRIRNPDSPYQRDRRVTDPVCGMTFHRAEAAATTDREGRTYYFCVEDCKTRFLEEPKRYV
jgi:YHS domain-containing protein